MKTDEHYRIGLAREEMHPPTRNIHMYGWGDPNHIAKDQATPLFSRAVVIQEPQTGKQLILACLEICFITEALRIGVLSRLRNLHPEIEFQDSDLVLTAIHTHSAPGGYSDYVTYSLTSLGFHPEVYESYVEGAVRSIVVAFESKTPATIKMTAGLFPPEEQVAFNRSLKAWRANPEAASGDIASSVNREMVLLRFDSADGKPLGSLNWFSVHCTSMHRDMFLVHSDNKGIAASKMEKEFDPDGARGFVSIFAQGAAGDVSPNFKKHFGKKEIRGVHRDDEASCQHNGGLQARMASRLYAAGANVLPLQVSLKSALHYYDFGKVPVDMDFAGGREGLTTAPGEIGCRTILGAPEGSAAPMIMFWIGVVVSAFNEWRQTGKWTRTGTMQAPKRACLETGKSRILGFKKMDRIFLPSFVHPFVSVVKSWAQNGIIEKRPLAPEILPIQLVALGNLLIAAVPSEFSTVAGQRLERALLGGLNEPTVFRAIITGYANAYSSYVTTPEEYDVQSYEGASTLFGKWTLPAYQTLFRRLLWCLFENSKSKASQSNEPQPAAAPTRAAMPLTLRVDRNPAGVPVLE